MNCLDKKYILRIKNAIYGEEVCIFSIPKALYIIDLCWKTKTINIEKGCPEQNINIIYKEIEERIFNLEDMPEEFKNCTLSLAYYNNTLYLLFYSLENVSFSFKLTKKFSNILKLPTLPILWEGTFTHSLPHVFKGDVLVLKK